MHAWGPVVIYTFVCMHIKQNRIGLDIVLLWYQNGKECQQTL